MKEIDQHIKAYYTNKSLSSKQLEAIEQSSQVSPKRIVPRFISYAAAISLLALCAYFLLIAPIRKQDKMVHAFSEEVAFNHEKQLSSDIVTSTITELNTQMNKLDFELGLPQDIQKNYQLLGGRYCSVDNRIAAQLKVKNSTGSVGTLYVLKKVEPFDIQDVVLFKKTKVDIWDDGKLLFVFANDI